MKGTIILESCLPWENHQPKPPTTNQSITPPKFTLQGTNISHLGNRKIIFKMPFLGDMLVPPKFNSSAPAKRWLEDCGLNSEVARRSCQWWLGSSLRQFSSKQQTPLLMSKGHTIGCFGLKDGGLDGWWFQIFFFSPLPEEMIKFDYNTFQMDCNHQLDDDLPNLGCVFWWFFLRILPW